MKEIKKITNYLFKNEILIIFLVIIIQINLSTLAAQLCEVDKKNSCGDLYKTCMNIEKDKTNCVPTPQVAPIDNFLLPFDKITEVVCTHASGVGSHSWQNAFYAIDLATPYELPASSVRASADGKAFTFLGEDGKPCPSPIGTPSKTSIDNCALGWGNHIKILHSGGYYSFYAHLEKVLINNGQFVKQGDPIGIEGATGLAGHRHLHWSVQKLPGKNKEEWEKQISWAGISVPFNFKAYINNKDTSINTSNFPCAHAGIGQVPADKQPRLKGIK